MKLKQLALGVLFIIPVMLVVIQATRTPRIPPMENASPDEKRKNASNIVQNLLPLTGEWASADFYPIEETEEFSNKLLEIPIAGKQLLSPQQETQLRDTIKNYLLAYNLGDFKSFRRFRAPVSEFRLARSVVDFMREDYKATNERLPEVESVMFELYWTRYVGSKFVKFWTGVSLVDSSAEVKSVSTSVPSLKDYVMTQKNGGVVTVGPILTFDIVPSESSTRMLATVRLLAKNSDVTCPVYCRFIWDDKNGTWLPIEQVAAYGGPRKTSLMF